MDDYSKLGPKSYKAEASQKAREEKRSRERLLESNTEQEFIEGLEKIGVTRKHPGFNAALQTWREQHL